MRGEKTEKGKEKEKEASCVHGCRECLKGCPEKLPIPDLMRAYVDTYGYRNLGHAQDLVLSLNLPAGVCEDCSQCSVKCLNGWNVAAKIRDVVHLRDVPLEFIT